MLSSQGGVRSIFPEGNAFAWREDRSAVAIEAGVELTLVTPEGPNLQGWKGTPVGSESTSSLELCESATCFGAAIGVLSVDELPARSLCGLHAKQLGDSWSQREYLHHVALELRGVDGRTVALTLHGSLSGSH
jgi:hypothetical protein